MFLSGGACASCGCCCWLNHCEGTSALKSNKVVCIFCLWAHILVLSLLGHVSLEFSVHIPANLLGCSHWVAELLLGKLRQGAELGAEAIIVWIALAHVELSCWLFCDCNQVFGIEVEIFVKKGVLLLSSNRLSKYCVILDFISLTF
jgi:hypothetical protein